MKIVELKQPEPQDTKKHFLKTCARLVKHLEKDGVQDFLIVVVTNEDKVIPSFWGDNQLKWLGVMEIIKQWFLDSNMSYNQTEDEETED